METNKDTRIFIYPYMNGSVSVKRLKYEVGAKKIRLNNSRYRDRLRNVVINWGNSRTPQWMSNKTNILNKPSDVGVVVDKIRTFIVLSLASVQTVPFTTDKDVANRWLNSGHTVFTRKRIKSHSGDGIVIARPTECTEVEDAPLYTVGIENNGEYRVHVFNGKVILYQKKSMRLDEDGNVITATGEDNEIRNLKSGWIYRTGNLKRLKRIEKLALNAISAVGLDFGAVDIIMGTDGRVYVLEINSAPGLKNTQVLQAYKDAINSHINDISG